MRGSLHECVIVEVLITLLIRPLVRRRFVLLIFMIIICLVVTDRLFVTGRIRFCFVIISLIIAI